MPPPDHVARRPLERDADAWAGHPLTDAEASLRHTADWGPAEDWADWLELGQ